MATELTKVIIADDHLLFADGLEQILTTLPELEVIAKVSNGKLLLQALNKLAPDLILLDINMPLMNGIEAALYIRKQRPGIKIVFLSMYYDEKIRKLAQENGIMGLIIKDTTAPLLKNAILEVLQGHPAYLLPEQHTPIQRTTTPSGTLSLRYKLTSRETEIIRLIKEGKSNKQIAADLELSNYTIETHRKNIYRKLNLQGTGQLILFANEHNL